MRRILLFVPLAAAVALGGTSCYSTHPYGSVHTKRSAVVGGALGAGVGALVGEHNDRELEGAAVGGVLGAIAGGVLGSARDESYGYRGGYYQGAPSYHRSYYPAPRRYYYSAPSYSYSYHDHHYHHRPRGYGYRSRSSYYCR